MGNQLSNNELMGDFTEVITLTFEDIQSAGTTATAFATIPAGGGIDVAVVYDCLLYTSPSPRDQRGSRMPSSA